jgi:hypothetical protein
MLSTRFLAVLLLAAACTPAPEAAPAPDLAAERAAVDSVLSEFHQLASEGSWERYFALFTPDAVFFGTDATERWSVDEFRGYADGSSGWTYLMTERNVFVAGDGNTAWFDERLQNARYGETRGTGVLARGEVGWKLTQYNLTIPIPNDLAAEFADRIKALEGGE